MRPTKDDQSGSSYRSARRGCTRSERRRAAKACDVIAGRATAGGTRRYASRFPMAAAGHFGELQGLTASSIGRLAPTPGVTTKAPITCTRQRSPGRWRAAATCWIPPWPIAISAASASSAAPLATRSHGTWWPATRSSGQGLTDDSSISWRASRAGPLCGLAMGTKFALAAA